MPSRTIRSRANLCGPLRASEPGVTRPEIKKNSPNREHHRGQHQHPEQVVADLAQTDLPMRLVGPRPLEPRVPREPMRGDDHRHQQHLQVVQVREPPTRDRQHRGRTSRTRHTRIAPSRPTNDRPHTGGIPRRHEQIVHLPATPNNRSQPQSSVTELLNTAIGAIRGHRWGGARANCRFPLLRGRRAGWADRPRSPPLIAAHARPRTSVAEPLETIAFGGDL
jgi:hypothetical protein